MREDAPSLQQLIVNGWKNSSSAFFIIVQRDFYRGTALFRANAKYLLDEKVWREKAEETRKHFVTSTIIDRIFQFSFIHFSSSSPPPLFFQPLIKLIKQKLLKHPRFHPLIRPFIVQRVGKRRKDIFSSLADTHTEKWNFIKVTGKRPNVGGNRVAFRVCRKRGRGEEASEFTLQKWWRIFADELDDHLCDCASPRARLISNSLDATTTEFPLLRVQNEAKNVTDSNFFPTCDKAPLPLPLRPTIFLPIHSTVVSFPPSPPRQIAIPVALGIRARHLPNRDCHAPPSLPSSPA